jgi:sulfatase modifying factor 1
LALALVAAVTLAGCGGNLAETEENAAPKPDPAGPPPEGMVLIRGGQYTIGSDAGDEDERPVRRVTLDPFYLDAREVTNAEFARFVETAGYQAEGNWHVYATGGRESHPVVGVTWTDASEYARWAGKRLPAEAEWEAAARGGLEGKPYPNGDELLMEEATFGALFETGPPRTSPVGSHRANGYGLHDMAGNAWEWCADYYAADAHAHGQAHNPTGPARGAARVARGGSWNDRAASLRVSNRLEMTPTIIGPVFGFRCAQSP